MGNFTVQYSIFQDWKANKGNIKAQLVLALFRAATLVRSNTILIILFFWYLIFYRFFVEWVLNIELPWSLRAGSGMKLEHGHSLVVNGESLLGKNVHLRHSTTIGNKKLADGTYSYVVPYFNGANNANLHPYVYIISNAGTGAIGAIC